MYNAEQRAKAIEAFAGFGRSESGVRTNSWTKSVRLQESIAARTGRSFHRCFLWDAEFRCKCHKLAVALHTKLAVHV